MRRIILVLFTVFFAAQVYAMVPPNVPAEIALYKLKEGNDRFVSFQMKHPNIDKTRRTKLINGQHPFAVIVACSDSRVAPEIIFDQGLGDIFVIRNAGNVINENVLENIKYAVNNFGVNLVVIISHEFCHEVGTVMREENKTSSVKSIKETITSAIECCKKENRYSYENVIKEHAKLSVGNILKDKEISTYMKKHDLKIISAYYNIDTGKVEFFK
ncbi:MAG: carbonic anhydrase [Candidatus Gastranaerophilales bacterium]|nr:carbonic anhydrase [Candidatus Gastranaerophilales bacterium]